MLEKMRKFVSPPVFEDAEKTQQAYLLNFILWALIGLAGAYLLLEILIESENLTRTLIQVGVGESINIFLLVLLRRGYVRAASILQVSTFWLFFTVSAITGFGVRGVPYAFGYGLVIVVSGILLGGKGALVFLVCSLLAGGLMVYAEGAGLIVPKFESQPLTVWMVSLLFFPLVALFQYWASRTLRESQNRLRLFFNQSLDGYFFSMLDEPLAWNDSIDKEKALDYSFAHQHITEANDAVLQQYGITREKFIGRTANDFWAHDLEQGRRFRRSLFDSGRLHVETEERKDDGMPIQIEGDYVCIYDSQNRITGMFVIQRDVTERKRAENALRQSEQRFRMVLENLGEGVAVQDKDWCYTYANPAAHAVVNWSPGTLIGATEDEILSPASRAQVKQHDALREQGKISSYETELIRPNGEIRTIIATGVPRMDEQGKLIETFVTFTDITERKQAEATLRHYAERLELLHEIDRAILSAHSPTETALAAVTRLRRLIPVVRASVNLFDFQTRQSTLLAISQDGPTALDVGVPISFEYYGVPIIESLLESQSHIVYDVLAQTSPAEVNQLLAREGVRSWLTTPLSYQGALIGAINLGAASLGEFTSEQIEVTRAVADQLAISIQQNRLLEATQKHVRELTVLHAVALASVSALTEDELLESVHKIIGDTLYPDMFGILLLDEAAQGLRISTHRNIPEETRKAIVPLNQGIVAAVATSGNARRVDDVQHDEIYREVIPGVQSELCVPIKSGERVLGVIDVESKQRAAFSEADERLLATMAGQLSNALERLRVVSALRQSEERYRLISTLSTDYVFSSTVHKDGTITHDWESGAFESISGYTPEEFRAHGGWRATLHPDDLIVDDQMLEKILSNQKATGELRVITKSGEIRWVRVYARPVWDDNENRLVGIYGAVQSIDEQKRAEEILRQRDAILQAVAHAAQVFLQSSNWRESINQTLDELGNAADASHVYIFENHIADGKMYTSQRYEWTSPKSKPEIENPNYQNVLINGEGQKYWSEVLSSGRTFVGNLDLLPKDEADYFQERGIKSILDVPIFVGREWWGVIGFDDYFNERAWSPAEIEALEIAGKMISAAIAREQIDEAFRQNEEKHRNELEEQVLERTSQLTLANKLLQTEKIRIEQVVDEVAALRRLSDFLQSSMTVEEASSIVASHMNSLFANTSGGLYLINDGFIDLALISSWGDFKTETVIQPNDCWGMRRGRSFVRHVSNASPACAHFDGEIPDESLCLPLMGQNEIIGMLCLQIANSDETYFTQDVQNLAIASADSVALALANLRLRERLHNQSVRDPLTGLFNRRYLEETLARETHRASRNQNPLCVIMFEIDDFKRYNNTFGHDAGDYVLRKVADTMRVNLRRSDFPCRYGGDEFTLLLPETTLEDGATRAESLRKAVEALTLSFNNQALGQVTVRMGVAAYPKHGETGEAVLKVADDASYRARAIGKNCVVVAE